MDVVRTCFFCLFVIFTLVEINQCGKYGGSRGGSYSRGGGTYNRGGSGTRISSRPVTSRPVSYHPTQRRPATSHFTTARTYQRSTHRPISQPQSTRRPISQPQPTQYRPRTTPRPYDTFGKQTSRPNYQTRPTSPPIRPTTPRRYTTSRPVVSPTRGAWALPPKPAQQQHHSTLGSSPHGYPQQTYTPYHGPSKVKIVNKYKYNYPGYYSAPVPSSYAGYYHSPTYYHYRSSDTGSTALGFFLGYGLGRLSTPTYSHYSFYDGYTPRYDHYTVHHYYHNRESVPQRQEIPSNTIVGCVGDSSTVCPGNTVSLCTSSGALMCVVSATATTACGNNIQGQCVNSEIPCINNTAPECKNSKDGKATVSIPCISTAEVQGEVKYVDNTLVANLPANASQAVGNGTQVNGTSTVAPEWSTKYPITTTPSPQTVVRDRREAPRNFCVTVLALPAKKQETEGEKLLSDAKDIAAKFMESVWGL